MAKFDFLLFGNPCIHRVEVAADGLEELTAELASARFVSGELDPDEWGQVRRVAIRSDRIQFIVESN
ncbi:hypothetical protein ACPVPU_03405 [Sphingomonas sp. CJ99]